MNLEARKLAFEIKKQEEKVELWPYDCDGGAFVVAIFARSFFPPPAFHPEGFLIMGKNAEVVQDWSLCMRVARDFYVWHRMYFHPVEKYVPLRGRYFSTLRQLAKAALDSCKGRYENNLYKYDDPAKKTYNEVLKKLDLDVIQNYPLLLKNLEAMERIIDIEKSLWQRCSCEGIEHLKKELMEYQSTCLEMVHYLSERSQVFYEYEQAIKSAFKIDLQVSRYSILSKLSLSFLLWAANTNLSAIAIPLLPEALKWFYQTFVGYKSLLKKSQHYHEKTQELVSIINLLEAPVDEAMIRNFSQIKP